MTRRGSLVYYLSAWICGGLFVTLAGYFGGSGFSPVMSQGLPGAVFLVRYFLVLVFGACSLLVFAFLLRRAAVWLRLGKLWQWLAAACVLAVPMGLAIRWAAGLQQTSAGSSAWLRFLFLLAAAEVSPYRVWLAIPVAAATSIVLFLIHRAFAESAA